MLDPTVGILYQRKSPSAKRLVDIQDPEVASLLLCDEHVPLSEALSRKWAFDAHAIIYRVDADQQGEEFAFIRASKRSPFVEQLEEAGGRISVPVLFFDYDLPKVNGQKQEWSPDRLSEFVQGLAQTPSLPEPTVFYDTLHGARFVYVLTQEVSELDAEALIRGMVEAFTACGVELDTKCLAWPHLFRLPNTFREDSQQQFVPQMILGGGPMLDPITAKRVAAGLSDKFADADQYSGEMPDPDEVRAMLSINRSGKMRDTALVKMAKSALMGRDAHKVVFGDRPLAVGDQGWNNQVLKIVGSVVGMTARREEASPEGVYALLHGAVEQLQARENKGAQQSDWYALVWDFVCRMWSTEESQIAAEHKEAHRRAGDAKEQRKDLLQKVREEYPDIVPEEEEEAETWFERRMIASDGRRHHVMRPDGSYNVNPVIDSMLIPMIRELGMEDIIQTTEIRGKNIIQRSSTSLLNDYAVPITGIECSSALAVAYIEGSAGFKTLHIPVHRLNPKLTSAGVFDPLVDRWLRHLGGKEFDRLQEWLSHSLDVSRAICALNLYGSPGTGKGMLAAGLSECFEGEKRNDGRALGKFNAGLLSSPIVNCDEGVPKISNDEAQPVDQAFRNLVTGGKTTIRRTHRDPFNADIYPRIIFTSNDRDIITSIVGHRDLTLDDIQAIEQRLLSIEVDTQASIYLTSKGNYSYTAGWIAGSSSSKYTLANHIKYLFINRVPSIRGQGRLLVEGESQTVLVREMRLRSKGSQMVLRALVQMINMTRPPRGTHRTESRVWTTPSSIVEFAEGGLTNFYGEITLQVAGRVLRQFASEGTCETRIRLTTPEGAERGRWIELDLGVLYEEGLRYGMDVTRIERMVLAQPCGEDIIAAVVADGS